MKIETVRQYQASKQQVQHAVIAMIDHVSLQTRKSNRVLAGVLAGMVAAALLFAFHPSAIFAVACSAVGIILPLASIRRLLRVHSAQTYIIELFSVQYNLMHPFASAAEDALQTAQLTRLQRRELEMFITTLKGSK